MAKESRSLRLSDTANELFNKTKNLYVDPTDPLNDQMENAIVKICEIARREHVRGTHPHLGGQLQQIDETITTLIKQIDGIIAGQDNELASHKAQLEQCAEAKRQIQEEAKKKMDAAEEKEKRATEAVNQANLQLEAAKKETEECIRAITVERDQAIRERDDARIIASEKTSNNDLLIRQMKGMQDQIRAHEQLKSEHESLIQDYNALNTQLIKEQGQAALAIEKAVYNKEREMQVLLREADRENALLTARIEQLQSLIDSEEKHRANT